MGGKGRVGRVCTGSRKRDGVGEATCMYTDGIDGHMLDVVGVSIFWDFYSLFCAGLFMQCFHAWLAGEGCVFDWTDAV